MVNRPKNENEFVWGQYWTTPSPIMPQNLPKRGANRLFPAKLPKTYRSHQTGWLHHFQRRYTTRQGDFVGGLKLENNKSNTQAGVLGRFAPQSVCCFVLAVRGLLSAHYRIPWKLKMASAGARELEAPKYKCEAPCLPTAGYGGFSTGSVMTNCPKWAWSRSRDVLIFLANKC